MLNLLKLCAALAVLVMASSAALAEKLQPPTIALGESTTTIVVADYKEAGPADRIVFSKVEVLQSKADVPELIDIGKPDLREPLVAGKRYIIAYSPYAENRFEQIVVNPRGASFLSSPGIEPGLWEDSRENRALVMWRIDGEESEHERESKKESEAAGEAMPRLLKMLRSDDRQWREFSAAEIALRPALVAMLNGSDQKALQRFVASDVGPDRARASLLAVAVAMPAKSGAVQSWDAVVVDLLKTTPVKTLGIDRRSALILAALSYPPTREKRPEGALYARWLHSDDMALVEMAAMALQEISLEAAKTAFDAALSDDGLPNDNRSVIDGFKLRQELMKPAS
ncbi:MAG: hypothetical protein WBP11_08175 [Dokdonella sp.]